LTDSAAPSSRRTAFVSMLRGINVGGQKTVRMGDLKALYESLGFQRVLTYIQSGNVVFDWTGNDPTGPARMIREGIGRRFGFDVSVIIRTAEELDSVAASAQFPGKDEAKVHVTFLSGEPAVSARAEIDRAKGPGEECVVSGKEVFLFLPNGYAATKLSNAFLEKKLGVTATTRNWRTVKVLHSMMSDPARARPARL
jgi:uncharacterized protein (DUF1697 family)